MADDHGGLGGCGVDEMDLTAQLPSTLHHPAGVEQTQGTFVCRLITPADMEYLLIESPSGENFLSHPASVTLWSKPRLYFSNTASSQSAVNSEASPVSVIGTLGNHRRALTMRCWLELRERFL